MRRRALALGMLTLLAACAGENTPTNPANSAAPAPGLSQARADAQGRYIVVLKGTPASGASVSSALMRAEGIVPDFVYNHAIGGFAARLTPQQVARLQQDARVDYVQADGVVHLDATQSPTPSWGLDRIDQMNLPLNNSYTYSNNGSGVHFYGIDTGILYSHVDFGGRASPGFDAITSGGGAVDCNGHGTHTATTAAGTTYGVAKGMTVVGVRVLNCAGSGTFAQVIAGIDWVTANAIKPAVANMSLGGSFDAATNTAVQNSIASGVVYAVSAGNSSANACTQSPAAVPEALTVGATDINDNRASFSNFGTCLDLFGPGVNITAGWIGSNTATATISGTSMSSPHVAGVAGLYLAANPTATPAQVAAALVNNATSNKVGNPGTGSPNKLLYMGFIGGGGPPNMPPVADFSYTCDASLNCSFDGTLSNDPDGSIVAYAWKLANGNTVRTTSTFSRTFPNPATFDLTLEVTDNGGLTSSITKTVNVTGGGPGNMPPTASFTWNCDAARHCTFDGTGSTDDNGIVSYDWQVVGTSITRNGSTISTTFPGPKTFDLKLTVTDGGGLSDSQTQTINVP